MTRQRQRQQLKKSIEYSSASLKPKMIAFHRPFRRLAKNAFILSAALCLLYAHCWSRTLSVFKTSTEDGAVCRAVFTPFVRGDEIGAKEGCIWYLWSGTLFIMLISFAQDEWNGLHYQKINEYDSESDDEGVGDKSSRENHVGVKRFREGINSLSNYLSESTKERPKDTLDMVSHYMDEKIGSHRCYSITSLMRNILLIYVKGSLAVTICRFMYS